MTDKRGRVCAVVVSFNSMDCIGACLDSLFRAGAGLLGKVAVVDNNSCDGTAGLIASKYPQVLLIRNNRNLGAAKARNQGIELVKEDCEWVLTLDCDVILDEGFLRGLLAASTGLSGNVGILQPKILMPDKRTIYSSGVALSFFRRFYDIGRGEPDGEKFNAQKKLFGSCAAASLYKKELLEEVKDANGYFDERFFFLAEDVDLSWRAQKKRWGAIFVPQALCFHQGNSCRFDAKLRQYLCFRNRYYMIRKNQGLSRYALSVLPLFLYDIPRLAMILCANRYVLKQPQFLRRSG